MINLKAIKQGFCNIVSENIYSSDIIIMNKVILPILIFILLGSLAAYSQVEFCGHVPLLEQGERHYPGYKEAVRQAFEESKRFVQKRTPGLFRIPVVFHVVWNNSFPAQNIPDSCITRQVQILNDCFRARNSDKGQLRPVFGFEAMDSEIEFYLADKDPAGNPASGIVRRATNTRFTINPLIGVNIDMKSSSKGGSDPWPVDRYLNIWVVNMPLNFLGQEQVAVLGFATPPANLPNWPSNATQGVGADGIVMQFHFIGDNNPNFRNLPASFSIADRGRALVHEAGHYLGLRHIWADKGNALLGTPSCTNAQGQKEDDGMGDTPYCGGNSQTAGCNPTKNTCNEESPDLPDMWENYMDYAEERCQVLFTPQQIDFMRSVLDTRRKQLVSWNEPSHTTDFKPGSSMLIFPNPVISSFRVEWNEKVNPEFLEIRDQWGREILMMKVKGKTSAEVELFDWPSAVYYTRLLDQFGKMLEAKNVMVLK